MIWCEYGNEVAVEDGPLGDKWQGSMGSQEPMMKRGLQRASK